MYGPCSQPCTRHVYGRVHVSMCLRVQGPGTRPCNTRPKTAVYTAVHGLVTCRLYGRVRAVSARVHGSVRAVCTAVFGRVHGSCTLPFSAVYMARTRQCNCPCTRPCTRSQTARYGRARPVTAYGPCTRPSTRPVLTNMYTAEYETCTRPCTWHVTTVYTAHGRNVPSRPVYAAV